MGIRPGFEKDLQGMLSAEKWFLVFWIYSVCGWIWESVFYSFWTKHRFIDRGFLKGPYCPIYGCGAILNISILGRVSNPVLLLFLAGVMSCVLEYATSYAMEKLFHARWWDYSDMRFNINGRICLLGFLGFGAASVVLIKLIHPFLVQVLNIIPLVWLHIITAVLLSGYLLDNIVTFSQAAKLDTQLREISGQFARLKDQMADYLETDRRTRMEHFFKQSLDSLSRSHKRLLHAFPRMQSLRYPYILQILKNSLNKRHESKSAEEDADQASDIQ